MKSSFRATLQQHGSGQLLRDTCVYFFTATRHADDDDGAPQWFAYRTNDRLSFEAEQLLVHRARLHQLLHRLRARHMRRGGMISIGGYSQGACMALDVALTAGVQGLRVLLVAGFCMLPRYVSCFGWHGYVPSKETRLSVWVLHGKRDSEISWALARRSYDAMCEMYGDVDGSGSCAGGAGVELAHVCLTDHDHWSIWETPEASQILREFSGEAEDADQMGEAAASACSQLSRERSAVAMASTDDSENVPPSNVKTSVSHG